MRTTKAQEYMSKDGWRSLSIGSDIFSNDPSGNTSRQVTFWLVRSRRRPRTSLRTEWDNRSMITFTFPILLLREKRDDDSSEFFKVSLAIVTKAGKSHRLYSSLLSLFSLMSLSRIFKAGRRTFGFLCQHSLMVLQSALSTWNEKQSFFLQNNPLKQGFPTILDPRDKLTLQISSWDSVVIQSPESGKLKAKSSIPIENTLRFM